METDEARAALKARQGKGARYDSPAAPAEALLLARLETAYFSHKINALSEAELDAPSLLPGLAAAISWRRLVFRPAHWPGWLRPRGWGAALTC